jgi:hypothetical protein
MSGSILILGFLFALILLIVLGGLIGHLFGLDKYIDEIYDRNPNLHPTDEKDWPVPY